ncbi:hypothetical protein [Acinetobacter rathckeae]|uniref:hypothetical protein n=1 Tax=Acinetobacter rathckeae TaxID=2605272 RepID=UPI0018A251C3|nr:hypothetical protein [Acinetobacter rathckeae]MBF7688320.1 hypothetical protein [Acinetobacter rathckeae]MBF7695161.1 hypothetical protein [Acinetobacter rathckeae]
MTLNVGENFTTRWLNTPDAVRATYIADLERICQLLQPNSQLDEWQQHNEQAQQQSQQCIDATYAELKAQRLEKAKQQEQLRREQNLAQQRQQEKEQQLALTEHEHEQQQQRMQSLQQLKTELLQQSTFEASRGISTIKTSNKKEQQALESMNILLELEAEELANKLKQVVNEFTQNLHQATQEEIKLSLAQMAEATHAKNK